MRWLHVLVRKDRPGPTAPIVRLAALAAAWCGAAAARPAAADTIVYQTGFEASDGFIAGQPLVGQDGWVARLGLNPDAATVVAEDAATGSQAVRIDGALLTDPNPGGIYFGGYYPMLDYDPVANGTPIITVSADILLALNNDISQATYAGFATYALTGGSLNNAEIGGPDGPDGMYGYYHVSLVDDFANMTGRWYIDGQLSAAGPLGAGSPSNLVMFAYGQDAPPTGFVAYFDNFSVTASVPEPGSFTLLAAAVGTVGLVTRRRNGGSGRAA